ncbi:ribonuclease Z [Anaerobacillus alkalilacustris]|uniref:Ribonuclease Z n=1 Tax=Anaerobacillus alkalilacustris TaxID=393763 RepID=A0A1S2LSW5_9BACI|nr:ribonuclease Z [Anaerobacillus alkalilacustris]OIJ14767.1 ribonuclease Z [Anaerobacillus alkalilacustris]
MVKLQFLGTCAGIPSKMRNVSSLVIQMLQYQNECWMFDCGEATQHQLLHSPLTLSKITKIFITHLHGDHIYGLPGVIGSRSFQGATEKLQIFGPKGIKNFIETTLTVSNTYVRYPLEIIEIQEGLICKNDFFSFEAVRLEHGIVSYGYRIVEKDLPGPIDVEKLKSIGVTPGPIYKELKAGKKVKLPNGKIIDGKDYCGPKKVGKIIAIGGDTRKCESIKRLAKDANILIHEATFLDKDRDLAFEHFHSTAFEAAKTAKECNVKVLFLNHISSRYCEGIDDLLREARSTFINSYIPHDLQTYLLHQNDEVVLQLD